MTKYREEDNAQFVVYGSSRRFDRGNYYPQKRVLVNSTHRPPSYHGGVSPYDIALLELVHKIPLDESVQLIEIDRKPHEVCGEQVHAFGFGVVEDPEPYWILDPRLQMMDTVLVNNCAWDDEGEADPLYLNTQIDDKTGCRVSYPNANLYPRSYLPFSLTKSRATRADH